jgi:proline iminopeptidase
VRLIALALVLIALANCTPDRDSPAPESEASVGPAGDDAEQWYFWTDDGVQHYAFDTGTAAGPGDTVIVLHGGWGAEHSYLVRPLSALGDRYRLVFYDQRGSLRSPAPDSTIRLLRLVDDLEHLRESLGLEQVTLVAHSMGGALAYAYLSRYPERVRGLVLIGAVHPAHFRQGPPMEFIRGVWPEADSAALAEAQQAFFREYGERALVVMEEEGLVPDSLRGVPFDSLNLWPLLGDRDRTRQWRITFTAVNSCNPRRWREMEGGMVYYSQNVPNQLLNDETYAEMAEEFWPALRGFQGPVRVIVGTCDYVDLGPAIWPRIVEHLPDGALTVVDESGHAIWMDDPEGFEEAVRGALGEVGVGPQRSIR